MPASRARKPLPPTGVRPPAGAASTPSPRLQRGIQSVEVGGQLLRALAHQGRPMALKDLAREAGMSAAKAHPYLVSFGKLGLIEQDALSGRYGLGPLAMQLGLDQPAAVRPGAPGHAAHRRAGAHARPHRRRGGVGQPRPDHGAHRGGAVRRAREHAPRHGHEPARHGVGPAVLCLPAARCGAGRLGSGAAARPTRRALRRGVPGATRAGACAGAEPGGGCLGARHQCDGRARVRCRQQPRHEPDGHRPQRDLRRAFRRQRGARVAPQCDGAVASARRGGGAVAVGVPAAAP